ncbi:hypothetical protein LCGC14_2242950 [marine sediment metagenome]|uniref:Uncharacterized protein n=1 Tax=marine sediment metagenome TaxID=412755 RepID=A0A0F9D4J4_9ZZZZ
MSNCRSCGVEIKWIRLRPQMKPHPVDPMPKKVIVLGDVISDGSPVGKMVDGYTSHFASCPDAGQWRSG